MIKKPFPGGIALVGNVGLLDLIQENRQYDIDRMMGLRVWCVSVLCTYTND
jgi:hypothetical protein